MSDVKPIPEGFERAIPYLIVNGAADAIQFYKKAFGAEELRRAVVPDSEKIMHAALKIGESVIFLCDDFPEWGGGKERHPRALGASPVTIQLYVEDVDSIMEQAQNAGATVDMPAMDAFWGDRYGKITDPFGHEWGFATKIKELSDEEMTKAAQDFFASGPCE